VTDQKTLDLIIRAQLKGGKDIASITKQIEELGRAIESQSAAAQRGESSIDELKASLAALKITQDGLLAQGRLLASFQKLGETISDIKGRVDQARAAYDGYVTSIADVEEKTAKQIREQDRLEKAYNRAQTALEKQSARYEQLGNALRELGLDTNDLLGSQTRLERTAANLGVTIGKGQEAIAGYADTVRKAREQTATLGKQQRDAARDAELFAAAQERAERAAQQRAQDAQTFLVERPAERQAAAAAAARADAEAQAQLQRQRALAELRRDIEERSAQSAREQARDTGLRKTADDAEAAARGYTTLARASNNLRPRVVSLREAITGITDPATAARTSLSGVEKQIEELGGALDPAKNSIREYQERLRELQAAQKAISGQANLIDDFRKQTVALREQRAELQAARAQVAQYAAAVREGGAAAEQFTQPLAEAEARLRRAAVAMRQQVEATRQSREALRAAGIDTRNLADAQDRLTTAAQRSTAAVRQLAEGARNVGTASKQGAEGFSVFNDEGRTTLSLAQRIRGEILALTATYIGLQGVLTLAGDSLRASTAQEGLRNTLAFALGSDGAQVTQQIEYLRQQADRLGIAFDEASKSYSRFAAAAIRSGAPLQEANFIFESFAEVGRVINLTPDQINGIFNAIGQSFSKGKIQAEELRQQIGERLPGAFAFAQEALRKQFPDLNKALEQGLVGAENMAIIAESVRRAAAGQLPAAIRSLDAEQQRFNNSVLFFKQEIADSGFGQAYINLLKELTELLKSEDGKQFAQDLSGLFSAVTSVIRFLVENFRELQAVAGIVAGLLGVKVFGALIAGATAAKAAVAGLALSLTALQKALLVLSAFVVGWNIGSLLRDKFVEVELFGIALVRGLLEAFANLKAGILVVFFDLPRIASNAFKSLINLFNNVFARPLILVMRNIADALQLDGAVRGLDRALDALTLRLNFELGDNAAGARRQAEAELRQIREITDLMADDAIRRRQPQVSRPGQPTAAPPARSTSNNTGPTEGEINARQRKIEALDNALNALDARVNRTDTQTLASQLAAVDLEAKRIQKQIDEIKKFNPEAAGQAQVRFDALVAEQRAAVTKKFNDQIAADREALLKKVEAAEAAAGRKERLNLQARLDAIRKDYAQLYRQIEEDRVKAQANNLSTGDLDGLLDRTRQAEQDRLAAEERKFNLEELQRRETQINDLVKAREQTLRTIEQVAQAGLITRQEADQQSLNVLAQTQPKIVELAEAGRQFAISMQGAIDPAALDEFITKLDLAVASAGGLSTEFDRTGAIIRNGIGRGVDSVLNNTADKIQQVVEGTAKWGDVFQSVSTTILQSLAQILREIGIAILRQQVLLALRVTGLPVPVAHSGAVVGQGSNRTRNVSPLLFAGAPRYHTGGIVGLAPDEYPAILQKNEEVLSTSDPRNVMNGGLSRGAAQPKAQRFVLVDDRSRVAEAMSGAEGEEVTMVHLRKNIPTLRQLIKGG
jgi:tape measure domain-containing protein